MAGILGKTFMEHAEEEKQDTEKKNQGRERSGGNDTMQAEGRKL